MSEQAEKIAADQPGFDVLPLRADVRRAIDEMGFSHPTPVQIAAFEPAIEGADLIVQARTGTGKTLGFALPLVDRLVDEEPRLQALVLAPTRELALQSAREMEKVAKYRKIHTVAIYGGASMERQVAALKQGAQIVSGTPGRVLDHIRRGTLDPRTLRVLVLDEADEMFSMGFAKELNAIMDELPSERQVLCFSATIDNNVQRISERRMHDPQFITLSSDAVGASEISHYVYICMGDKVEYLTRILDVENPESAIVFCNTKAETEQVARALRAAGYDADLLNGDLPQSEREKIMRSTREGRLRYMVATDVAARGIDISHLTHVINYGFPEAAEQYVHRTGRTGRAGRTGTAISIVGPENLGALYYLRLTFKIFPLERSLPSNAELQTQLNADRVEQLVDEFAGEPSEDVYQLTRRLLGHPQAERIVAGMLSRHLRTAASQDDAQQQVAPAPDKPAHKPEKRDEPASEPRKPRRRRAQAAPADAESRDQALAEDTTAADAREASEDRAADPVPVAAALPVEDDVMTTLYLNVGKKHGVAKAEITQLLMERAGLGGDDFGRVRVRDRHTFVGIPTEQAEAVIAAVTGGQLAGVSLLAEKARS